MERNAPAYGLRQHVRLRRPLRRRLTAFGTILTIALDQVIRTRNLLQPVFLYPIALSFIVTGLAWQWFFNPATGLQDVVRSPGFESFSFDRLSSPDRAIYTLVIAGMWHSSGLVMAIVYAGLGSIDGEIWRAGRVDGIPARACTYATSCRCWRRC